MDTKCQVLIIVNNAILNYTHMWQKSLYINYEY
jgi:hypothetical protein